MTKATLCVYGNKRLKEAPVPLAGLPIANGLSANIFPRQADWSLSASEQLALCGGRSDRGCFPTTHALAGTEMRHLIANFAEATRRQIADGRLNDALTGISREVMKVIEIDSSYGRVYSSPVLDGLCAEIGQAKRIDRKQTVSDHAVILVTAIAPTGGHSRVILDIANFEPAKRVTILVSNNLVGLTAADIAGMQTSSKVTVMLCPDGNMASRLDWMMRAMADLSPIRTYILQHHFDPVVTATAQPNLTGKLFYYHNCDHSLTLGVHISHATHVDFNGKGFYRCRDQLGICNNVYWPLTAVVAKPPSRKFANGALVTCCCGGFEKFETPHLANPILYSIDYSEVVATILGATEGRHIHIGPLSSATLDRIYERLAAAGIDRTAFDHRLFVPDLARALNDLGVDIYMGSMPKGGGRATVEAMGAGMPLLIHSSYRTVFFSDENEVYPEARVWRTLVDLRHQLSGWVDEELRCHAARSRAYFETHHNHRHFIKAMKAALTGRPSVVPARIRHVNDTLQAFWDERAASPGLT